MFELSILDFFNELLDNKDNCSYIEPIQNELIQKLLLFDVTGISYYINLKKYEYTRFILFLYQYILVQKCNKNE